MKNFQLKIKEEGGCELYNMYKVDTEPPYTETQLLHVSGDEFIYVDFNLGMVFINGVIVFKQ